MKNIYNTFYLNDKIETNINLIPKKLKNLTQNQKLKE